jgi:hypothetical protein
MDILSALGVKFAGKWGFDALGSKEKRRHGWAFWNQLV